MQKTAKYKCARVHGRAGRVLRPLLAVPFPVLACLFGNLHVEYIQAGSVCSAVGTMPNGYDTK